MKLRIVCNCVNDVQSSRLSCFAKAFSSNSFALAWWWITQRWSVVVDTAWLDRCWNRTDDESLLLLLRRSIRKESRNEWALKQKRNRNDSVTRQGICGRYASLFKLGSYARSISYLVERSWVNKSPNRKPIENLCVLEALEICRSYERFDDPTRFYTLYRIICIA